ncbi:MAG: hypothetical protein J5I90_14590 [Caldilineales bacterium]|nr:hypothetical protein [Caldilineales bacterium]
MARRKKQRLERTITFIQQKWGRDALRKGAGRTRQTQTIPHIATGFPALDAALGIGGIPRGRITVLAGAPTSGKVTLAALILSRAQGRGGQAAAYIDMPHACDADYLARCGVNLRNLLVVRPESDRQALEMTLTLAERSEIAAILFDHWSALDTSRDSQRYAAGVLDHLTGRLAKSQVTILALDDQPSFLRSGLAVTTGALAHYTSLQLTVSRENWMLLGPDVRGCRAHVNIQKNKFGPSGLSVPIEIHFNSAARGKGI